MRIFKFLILSFLALSIHSCKVSYGFTQPTSIDAETFQVNYFQNEARLVEPGIDRQFTTALQDLIVNQTSLDLVTSNG
ncbi:MAG: hypothetical protein KJN82_03905, partial [Bacteroidia bacterium]|nr:hypothetical protein [Bacteroidia bacterium]